MTEVQKYLLAEFNRCSNSPIELQQFIKETILTGVFDKMWETNVAPEYEKKTYNLGDLVMHDTKLYKCVVAISVAEDWNPEHWNEISVNNLLKNKADLVDGKVPSTQLPSYVSETIEVATYQDLPVTGAADTIYVTKNDGHSYRWTGTQYVDVSQSNNFFSVSPDTMNTMGALRTYINGINSQGLHCFFDFHTFVANAYVCTVLMWTQNSTNYCLIFDIINGRTFIKYEGYQDSDTIQNYVDRNQDDIIRALKITDNEITLGDVNTLLTEVNGIGHHVMFDVSALNAGAYLCTIFSDGTDVSILDIVSQKRTKVTYNASTTLLSVLQNMTSIGGLPEVTALDNEKALQVVNGAWGIGGKPLIIKNAPTSNILTDEEIEMFRNGFFTNDTYLGIEKGQWFPKIIENVYEIHGYVIGNGKLAKWIITLGTKTIRIDNNAVLNMGPYDVYFSSPRDAYYSSGRYTYINGASAVYIKGKQLPNYPTDNTKTYTLKLVNGELTWVQDV